MSDWPRKPPQHRNSKVRDKLRPGKRRTPPAPWTVLPVSIAPLYGDDDETLSINLSPSPAKNDDPWPPHRAS